MTDESMEDRLRRMEKLDELDGAHSAGNEAIKELQKQVHKLQEDYKRDTRDLLKRNQSLEKKLARRERWEGFLSTVGHYREYVSLSAAYAAEIAFLGPMFHKKMYSLAEWMYTGYDVFFKKYNARGTAIADAVTSHLFVDGGAGALIGAVVGSVIGATASYTASVVKEKKFKGFRQAAIVAFFTGAMGGVGGLLGAEFSDAFGLMIGSYTGTAIGLGFSYQERDDLLK